MAIKKGLHNIEQLSQALGHPHNAYPTVHIAGTNGKGSVSHMIAAVLQARGLRVGMYTSPHYRDFRERIKIQGILASKRWVTGFIHRHRDLVDPINPTFFEISVAMAFEYFKDKKVDIAVIETGMGGRLDSTNIIKPILSVITNISLDHQASLGHTLKEIAAEKAGIIKPYIPVVIGERQKETSMVFERTAGARSSDLYWAADLLKLSLTKQTDTAMFFDYISDSDQFEIKLDARGDYQVLNLRTALAALQILADHFELNRGQIVQGLSDLRASTNFIGRYHILSAEPLIVADAAHNAAGIQSLLASYKNRAMKDAHIVLGMVKEKEAKKLLSYFSPQAKYYFCKAKVPRAMDVELLKEIAATMDLRGKAYSSVGRALAAAKMSIKSKEAFILITGSSYVVAEVI